MSEVQNSAQSQNTGAELATQQPAMIDPFEAFRQQMGKTLTQPMTKIVEVSMGGWAALHGKTAGDRVADATCRMIGGDLASMMIAETRNSIAGKLFAQAIAETSIIGKSGTYKSDAEWLARVNAALPVGEDGKRSAYTLGTMRLYAKLYAKSELWAKTYNLQFGKDDGLYRSLGTTVCNRLAELETGGGLTREEFGKLIELCRNGGTVKIGDKEENVPACAPRSAKSVDVCYAALAESLGKALVLPAEKGKGKREPGGATKQTVDSANTTHSGIDDAEGNADKPEKTQPTAAEMFERRVAIVNASVDAAWTALTNMARDYVKVSRLGHEAVRAEYDKLVATITNPFAQNMFKAAVTEATAKDAEEQTAAIEFAVKCIKDAIRSGSAIPTRVKMLSADGKGSREVEVTPEHVKVAREEIAEEAKPKPKK